MAELPRISDAEWEVMKIIWKNHPTTANDVIGELAGDQDWAPKTVKTLINRLLNKGALGFEKHGKTYHYFPAVDESECVREESRTFLGRVFGGSMKPMLAQFVESSDLSAEDIDELKALLDSKKE